MKKICILLFAFVFIASCSWESMKDGLVDYDTTAFSMRIPKKWKVVEEKQNILPKPSIWKIELAVTSWDVVKDFAHSMSIISEDLEKQYDSTDYANSNNLWSENYYHYYKKIAKNSFVYWQKKDWLTSDIFIFDAKYNYDTPRIRFLQTGIVCGKKWYNITLAISPTIQDTLKYEYMISTFQCK